VPPIAVPPPIGAPSPPPPVAGPRSSNIVDFIAMHGDQVVVVPNGTYRSGDVDVAHPATSGPYKGWLVLVAQSPHGAVIDMRDAPLHLGANASRVLFVGFKFVNGSLSVDGNHIWFWHTDHSFPLSAWQAEGPSGHPEAGLYRSPDAVHVYASTSYDVRFYGSDVHDACDGFDISNSRATMLQGVHVWNTYGGGSADPADTCHDDAIDGVQGNSKNLTVLDSWLQGRVILEDNKGPHVGALFEHTWVSGSPSSGFTLTSGRAISIQRRDVYSWGHHNGVDVSKFGVNVSLVDSGVHTSAPPIGTPPPNDQWRWAHPYDSYVEILADAP
jgi:hypothetical protein